MLKEVLDGGDRALVIGHADEERIVHLADTLLTSALRAGDSLLLEPRSGYAYERIPKSEVEELDPGRGPGHRLHRHRRPDRADRADPRRRGAAVPARRPVPRAPAAPAEGRAALRPARLRQDADRQGGGQLAGQEGRRGHAARTAAGYFLNIKGPELLNKYVGETERHIRLIFQRAREKASEGTPVIVFFDEMDSIFRTRGSGVSSDVENTIVPQLLSEIDGVEGLENVIVIGASNREDMIDPAILRPGRLDVKIKIERPDAEAARDIFSKYILTDAADPRRRPGRARRQPARRRVAAMIQRAVVRMYSETEENRFLEVTYANGDKEVLYFKDFNSGAMIQNIVDRAKKMAIKDFLAAGPKGLRLQHLLDRLRGRVPGERGPAQHDQPRRLGPHLRQEGRADRLHPHARLRQGRRVRPGDRHDLQHRPIPVVAVAGGADPARDRRSVHCGSPAVAERAAGADGSGPGIGGQVGARRSAPPAVRRAVLAAAPAGRAARRRRARRWPAAAPCRRSRPRRAGGGRRHAERPAEPSKGAGATRPRGTAVSGQAATVGKATIPLAGVTKAAGRRLPLPDPGQRHRLQPGGHRHRCDPARRRLGVRPGPGPAERLVVGLWTRRPAAPARRRPLIARSTVVDKGFRKVGPKTAAYAHWQVSCQNADQDFDPRLWWLPNSKIAFREHSTAAGADQAVDRILAGVTFGS